MSQGGFQGKVIGIVEYPTTKQCHVEIDWDPYRETRKVMDRLVGRETEISMGFPQRLQHPNNISRVE